MIACISYPQTREIQAGLRVSAGEEMKMLRSMTLSAAVLAATAVTAQAGEGCKTCYQRVSHPAQTVAHTTPAQYGTVHETVKVRPAQTIARHIPAEMGTVAETVMVAPASKKWVIKHDAHGREIGCWVKVPAQYATQHRTVVTRPAQVVHEVIPAQYATQARTVMVRPAQVHHQVIPAEYGVRHRTEMVAPATDSWQPIGGHGRRHHKHY
jgi:hypothetical protein